MGNGGAKGGKPNQQEIHVLNQFETTLIKRNTKRNKAGLDLMVLR